MSATTPEPPPKNTTGEDVWPRVIEDVQAFANTEGRGLNREVWAALAADMQARHEEGIRRYGVPLQTHNCRNARVDLYQELLDACAYARQQAMETKRVDDWELYGQVLDLAHMCRKRMGATR